MTEEEEEERRRGGKEERKKGKIERNQTSIAINCHQLPGALAFGLRKISICPTDVYLCDYYLHISYS